ncbi:hypothetical protein KN1_25100 [Stygiolobus caldivivus]|uniref:Uncharacterized protein n=1 Tax=Stygiolobus caldivivus TaxID=2824673 RepID=A0A8D5U982_9CREN|nr:hypothetical protein KN1_25100 [Stygiolobus caldivivus]
MFELEYVVLPSDPSNVLRSTYALELIEKDLREVCNVVKAGASLLCAPSTDTLIVVFTSFNEGRQLNIHIKAQSINSQSLVNLLSKIGSRLREQGYVMTLATSSSIFK